MNIYPLLHTMNRPLAGRARCPHHAERKRSPCASPTKARWRQPHSDSAATAFTRLELLAVLAAMILLAAVALPALAGHRLQADRVSCVNNLRQIGQAYQLWGSDRGDGMPIRTDCFDGGLRGCQAGFINNAWFHYAWISNELATPSVLACPGDLPAKPARDFSGSADGGFMNPVYRNHAVSYPVSLDVLAGMTVSFIAADLNISVDPSVSGCSSGVTTARSIIYSPTSSADWLPGPHGQTGNLLLLDGRVLQTSTETLRHYLTDILRSNGDIGAYHILSPRY